jgi:glycosyltransferase involved in cell wall biosynthesis
MRLLFVSGVAEGGAPRSTLDLARLLTERGHEVGVILGAGATKGRIYATCIKATIKFRQATGVTWPRHVLRAFGHAPQDVENAGDVRLWRVDRPANALRTALKEFAPDTVVANSFPREQLRWLVADAHRAGVRIGLYLREEHAVTHLSVSRLDLDFVIANSAHLAAMAEQEGYTCVMVPSIVDLTGARVSSTRSEVLMINPVEENRPNLMRALAKQRPDIPCVLQESWGLPPAWRAELDSWTQDIPNLSLRAAVGGPAQIYRDARILLAPYPSGRPRVVLEAQYNAIPVVGLNQPGLAEAVGPGGLLIPAQAPQAEWVAAVERLWDDEQQYGELCTLASAHAQRDEVDPDRIVQRFENALAVMRR